MINPFVSYFLQQKDVRQANLKFSQHFAKTTSPHFSTPAFHSTKSFYHHTIDIFTKIRISRGKMSGEGRKNMAPSTCSAQSPVWH